MVEEIISQTRYLTLPWMFSQASLSYLIDEAALAGCEPHELLDQIISSRISGDDSVSWTTMARPTGDEPLAVDLDSGGMSSISSGYLTSEIDWSAVTVKERQSEGLPIRPQVSRILPMLLNLRILAAMHDRGGTPSLDDFSAECGEMSRKIRNHLKSEAGEHLERGASQKLSSGFVRTRREGISLEKAAGSMLRFTSLYVGGARHSDGRGTGVPWECGWINIHQAPPHAVTLTEEGKRLAMLEIPFFDHGELNGPIIPLEVTQEILSQFYSHMGPEAENIGTIRERIGDLGATNSELVRRLTDQNYGEMTDSSGKPMIRAAVERTAENIIAATINRLEEMGLVFKTRISGEDMAKQPIRISHLGSKTDRVRYHLSDYGNEIFQRGLSEWV